MWTLVWASQLLAWPLRGTSTHLPSEIITTQLMVPSNSDWNPSSPKVDSLTLAAAAAHTLNYMHQNPNDTRGVHAGLLSELGVTVSDVKATLAIIAFVGLHYPTLLQDPEWWRENFDHYAWKADANPRFPFRNHQIRLTRYVIYSVDGSSQKNDQFTQALWQTPNEELALDEQIASQKCPQSIRCQLTRQDILQGALEHQYAGKSEPLIWVNEHHFHEAQLQGTLLVKDENGERHWFNVHRSNQHPYIAGLGATEQARFWYFQRTNGAYGWGNGSQKIELFPGVSMAGDVDNLGLGKVFWIQSPERTTVGVLSDTGGAFQANLHQLDWFMGVYPDRQTLEHQTRHLPKYANVGILIRKSHKFEDISP
ncbi:MAG: hypothetical protein VXZ96_11905 [Myxococcota bacterium]|nr:hypothetical protein [Myxococcota bacterium]MEC8381023.1 hypothetical protein [Myxococcota bacterium]